MSSFAQVLMLFVYMVIAFLVLSWIFQLLWNYAVVKAVGTKKITYGVAMGLMVIIGMFHGCRCVAPQNSVY